MDLWICWLFNRKGSFLGIPKKAITYHHHQTATGDIVIIQEVDLEYNPQKFPKVISPILAARSDVFYGSRFLAIVCILKYRGRCDGEILAV